MFHNSWFEVTPYALKGALLKIMNRTIDKMELHPHCTFFPVADDRTIRDMSDDISRNGLGEPIITYEGKILDGRNRYLACEMAGVEPRYDRFEDLPNTNDPFQFVISKNLHRRHLNPSQLGLLAQEVLERSKQTVDQVAAQLKVSPRTIHTAREVKESASESMLESVRKGEASLNKVADAIKKAEKDTGVKVKKNTPSGDREKVQKLAQRFMDEPSLTSQTKPDKGSAQEFAGMVVAGEYNGKLYGKNIVKMTKIVATLNATMAELLPLFCETIPLAESLEKGKELEGILDSMNECKTSLTEQIASLRNHLAFRDKTPLPDGCPSTSSVECTSDDNDDEENPKAGQKLSSSDFANTIRKRLNRGHDVIFDEDILPYFNGNRALALAFLPDYDFAERDGEVWSIRNTKK